MSCQTCQHTLQNLGLAGAGRTFWCPRCGTLKVENGDHENFEPPKVVGYVRAAETMTVRTSVDHLTIQYAVPAPFWVAACEAVGIKAHGS